MFIEAEGPTALRPDLVRALSLSLDVVELDGAKGSEPFCAALSAVWNGRKGFVGILLRGMDRGTIRRFVSDQPITTEAELNSAVDEGLAFIESMGFTMDHPEFVTLEVDARSRRHKIWNSVRKATGRVTHLKLDRGSLRRGDAPPAVPVALQAMAADAPPVAEEALDDGPDPFEGWDHGEGPSPGAAKGGAAKGGAAKARAAKAGADAGRSEAEDDESGGKTVLGRLALVRRGNDLGPRARLLSNF